VVQAVVVILVPQHLVLALQIQVLVAVAEVLLLAMKTH
jgi:hypothetical protein